MFLSGIYLLSGVAANLSTVEVVVDALLVWVLCLLALKALDREGKITEYNERYREFEWARVAVQALFLLFLFVIPFVAVARYLFD